MEDAKRKSPGIKIPLKGEEKSTHPAIRSTRTQEQNMQRTDKVKEKRHKRKKWAKRYEQARYSTTTVIKKVLFKTTPIRSALKRLQPQLL